jgi:hypothetical protein
VRLERLAASEALLAHRDRVDRLPQQQLTPFERLTDDQMNRFVCDGGERTSPALVEDIQGDPGWPHRLRAVRELQALHHCGVYRIVFFLNIAPPACPHGDRFYDAGSSATNRFFLDVLGAKGTPVVSVYDAFLHRRPSRMPLAASHSIGNSNVTKAETLFAYVTSDAGPLRAQSLRGNREDRVKISPLSETAVRFPSVLIGTFDVVLMYFSARRSFLREAMAIAAAVLLALTPVHVIHSRLGVDHLCPSPFMDDVPSFSILVRS